MTFIEEQTLDTAKSHHLVVLVHGLWGNPQHLAAVATALRNKHPDPHLHVLLPKSNSGHFTYDGIELGGERVTKEIEEEVESLAKEGKVVGKLSIVGYSLGGLVARYAIGLLYSKGWFERIEPVNFTTFASPYLGARFARLGFQSRLFNIIGARTLSMSGRQLFLIDSFRDTGRPLLAVLADPKSIFIRALSQFKRRTLYANIINDRTAVFYTTAISRHDPFTDLKAVQINYIPGYEDVIVDPDDPVSAAAAAMGNSLVIHKSLSQSGQDLVRRIPTFAFLTLLVPVGILAFFVNSGIQSVRSNRRIRLHEQGKAGIVLGNYRIPLMVEDVQTAVEGVLDGLQSHSTNEGSARERSSATLDHDVTAATAYDSTSTSSKDDDGDDESHKNASSPTPSSSSTSSEEMVQHFLNGSSSTEKLSKATTTRAQQQPEFPTLALTPTQFEMIANLDAVGFKKYPVHIHHHRHSHAAIIVRMAKKGFSEGEIVLKHWLENEFDV
ncbi:MAG: hypothetical protein M1816_003770 [Peltula sp. TS41687]|nr:MAG: hypothetical protein M1816_003770 [Peltula sp. TS41687]